MLYLSYLGDEAQLKCCDMNIDVEIFNKLKPSRIIK